jgi:hypothetical protein
VALFISVVLIGVYSYFLGYQRGKREGRVDEAARVFKVVKQLSSEAYLEFINLITKENVP